MAVLFMLLMELALFIFARLSFFVIGMTTASRPKRENLGTVSVMDIQFSLGSRETEGGRGWSSEPAVDGRRPGCMD